MTNPDRMRETIRAYLAANSLSERELSLSAGMSEKAINQILSGKSQSPRGDTLQKLAHAMKMSLAELLGIDGSVYLGEARLTAKATVTATGKVVPAIPEIDVLAGAGMGGDALTEAFTDSDGNQVSLDVVKALWGIPESYRVNVLGLSANQGRIIEVRGDSMSPTLMTGDRVMVDTGDRVPSPDGLFALHDGLSVVVKRLELIPNSDPVSFQILSDNPKHTAYKRNLDEIHLIGRVVWLARKI